MSIISALISQCRREYGDEPKTVRVSRQGNNSVNIFNLGKFPVVEGSYVVYVSGIAKNEGGDYSIDLDNGDLNLMQTPANAIPVTVQHKYAEWRDKNWIEAMNNAVQDLNARGFFRQFSRVNAPFALSANLQKFSGPSACIDLYELLVQNSVSGSLVKPNVNWNYQQDSNTVIIGNRSSVTQAAKISYLRNLQTYAAASATIDVLPEWEVLVKKKAGANFYRSLAGKIAKQANANVDEGHFSFTNARTMANDLDNEYQNLALKKKPTRPAKDLNFYSTEGGVA